MGWSIAYHSGLPQQCTRPGCEAVGGMLVAGQLVINTGGQEEDAPNFRHFDCLSQAQKNRARKQVKGPSDLPGYRNMKGEDKKRVRETFGWNDDAQSVQGGQKNKGRSDDKADAKGKGKGKAPGHEAQGNAPGSSKQRNEARPVSPALSQAWYDNTPSWDDPEPPKTPQGTAFSGRGKEREGGNKQDGRRNAQPEGRMQPVPPSASVPQQPNAASRPMQTDNQNPGNRYPPTPRETAPVAEPPITNLGPPAPPTADIDPAVLMRLELEDKEAEARLAEAELLLAETRVKVETARRAVVAQKLMMARAGVSPTN